MKWLVGILTVWLVVLHAVILAVYTRPSEEKQKQAQTCVTDAFNCLISAPGDKQHRVFSDLRKALERDPLGAANNIISLGQALDRDGEYPIPEPIVVRKPGESGLPMPSDWTE